MARGGHGLPKGYSFTRACHALPFYTLQRGGLRPSSTPLDTPRRMSVVAGKGGFTTFVIMRLRNLTGSFQA
jgi:hypothetical protein